MQRKRSLNHFGLFLFILPIVLVSAILFSSQAKSVQAQMVMNCYTFSRNLGVGTPMYTPEMKALGSIIIAEKIVGPETNYGDIYDENYAAAIVQFQSKYGINPTGYLGSLTREKINSIYGCWGLASPTPKAAAPVVKVITPSPSRKPSPTPTIKESPKPKPKANPNVSRPATTAFSLVSSDIFYYTDPKSDTHSILTGTVVFKMKSLGGALSRPKPGDFDVEFIDFVSKKTIPATAVISVTPNRSFVDDGQAYTVTLGANLLSSDPRIGLGPKFFFMKVTGVKYIFDGKPDENQNIEGILTNYAALVRIPSQLFGLKLGDKGENVSKLQKILINLGYMPQSSLSGVYGNTTESALLHYKSAHGDESSIPVPPLPKETSAPRETSEPSDLEVNEEF